MKKKETNSSRGYNLIILHFKFMRFLSDLVLVIKFWEKVRVACIKNTVGSLKEVDV